MKKYIVFILLFVIFTIPMGDVATAQDVSVAFRAVRDPYFDYCKDMAYNGQTYVVIGRSGLILTSTDLVNWEEIRGVEYDDINSIEWNGKEFVAIGANLLKSSDGISWSQEPMGMWDADDNFFWMQDEFFLGRRDEYVGSYLYTTNDFINYKPCKINSSGTVPSRLMILNDQYVALYGHNIDNNSRGAIWKMFVSKDKSNWEMLDQKFVDIQCLTYFNGKYLLYALEKGKAYVYISEDLKHWDKKEIPLGSVYPYSFGDEEIQFVQNEDKIHVVYLSSEENLNTDQTTNSLPYKYKELISYDGVNFTDTHGGFPDYNQHPIDNLYSYNGNIIGLSKERIISSKNAGEWQEFIRPMQDVRSYGRIQWTGKEHIKIDDEGRLFSSVDRQNWSEYGNSVSLDTSSEIKWANGTYMVRYTDPDDDPRMIKNIKEGKIDIYSEDFKLLYSPGFDGHVSAMSYAKGMYYCNVGVENKAYRSADGINWDIYNDGFNIPLYNNGNHVVATNVYTGENPLDFYISSDGQKFKKVKYEKRQLRNVTILGNLYLASINWDEDKRWDALVFSDDGVYWTALKLPGPFLGIQKVYEKGDDLVVETDHWTFFYPRDEIHNKVKELTEKGSIYVELNNTVLGFDTPPVIEEERTLVPLRFIFENMGASVQWDDQTQSAIVNNNGKKITFSIDNTDAKVDGKIKKMDVPARLVNDKAMIPLRFISEELGYEVSWDESTNMASIKTK